MPLVVGLGGTTRPASSSERALRVSLDAAAAAGAEVVLLSAGDLDLPMYAPHHEARTQQAKRLVDLVGRADGLIVASPGYHGGISGLIKNALDYIEDLREADRVYLDGRAVGCIAAASGWQATTTTLSALRSVVHALRGWPTPLGVAINSSDPVFRPDGSIADESLAAQLALLGRQVVEFARLQAIAR